MKYPAIHNAASVSSDAAQRIFLWLVRLEYLLLIFVSLTYLFAPSNNREVHIGLMIAVVASLVVFGFRTIKKPDEDWYQFRALAESAKTMTWRYAMRAEPFQKQDIEARATFRNRLKQLLEINGRLGARLSPHSADGEQITAEMTDARKLQLTQRKTLYLEKRIRDQRTWYTLKASSNKKAGQTWFFVVMIVYISLLVVLGSRVAYPDISWLSPDPLLVIGASIIGWVQVKKFNDLSAAYFITAQEIGIVATELEEISEEDTFSDFINSAELVFSREHTQWIARQRS